MRLSTTGFILAAAIAAGGCTVSRPAARDTVTVALRSSLTSLNPLLAADYDESYISVAIFDGLVERNDAGAIVPDLALEVPSKRNGGVSPDGRTIVYHLRRNVRWHDGVRLTAADVTFTYRLMRDPRLVAIRRPVVDDVRSVEAPDAFTVRVRLGRPRADAPQELFVNGEAGAILPAHILSHETDVRRGAFNAAPVGTGPYRFSRWERGVRLVLDANAAYFRGAPTIRHLVALESTPAGASLDIRTRRADVAVLRPEDAQRVRREDAASVRPVVSNSLFYLVFRSDEAASTVPGLRAFLASTIDRGQIVRTVLHGMALPATSFQRPGSAYYVAGAFEPPRRPPVRDGVILTYEADSPDFQRVAILLAQQWQRAGVATSLRGVPPVRMFGPQGVLARGDFQIALIGESFDLTPDRSAVFATFAKPPHGENFAHFSDRAVDAFARRALETGDAAQRRRLYAAMERRIDAQVPYVPLFWGDRVYAVDRQLLNFRPEPVHSDLWNVWQWRWSPRP